MNCLNDNFLNSCQRLYRHACCLWDHQALAHHTLLGIVLVLGIGTLDAHAERWRVDPERSRLGFTATQMGAAFNGQFTRFTANLVFDPEHPTLSYFDVIVDMASVDTQNPEWNQALPTVEWFNTAQFPKAHFESVEFKRVADDLYEVKAQLTLRDVTRDITVPFTFKRMGKSAARLEATTTLLRTDYGIGQGEWSASDVVGHAVTVVVDWVLIEETL